MAGGRRRSRKMRGGNGYGVGAPIAVGALEYVPNMTSVVGGAPYTPTGGRRRRRGGAVDVDVPPVVGDIVADDGSKLFPEQQCVAAGRMWTAAPFGYTLTDAGNGQLGLGAEIADPKNDNGDPLGRCSGTSPPPNMGPTAPRAEEGGRRRRRSRRRGGAEPIYATAPLDPNMVTKSQCPEPYVFLPSIKNAAGVMLGYCQAADEWRIATKLIKHKGGRRTRHKSKGRRRRTMRGGGSVSGVGYSFTGSGSRGLADFGGYESNPPVGGAFAIPTGTR